MATITLQGKPIETGGVLPAKSSIFSKRRQDGRHEVRKLPARASAAFSLAAVWATG